MSEAGVLSVSLKTDKVEDSAVIKFFEKEGLPPKEIHLKFVKVYGDSSPSFSTITSRLPSLNVAVLAFKIVHVKDIQNVQQHLKSLNKCMIWYWSTSR
jgi:hypothetical protein